MDEPIPPAAHDRLRLAESLLRAVEESVSSLQRLLSEVRAEVGFALREDQGSARENELAALRSEVDQLREGMVSRAVIERAKGMLMERQGLTESQSFELLNQISQRCHRKLRDVAADIANGSLQPHLAAVAPEAASEE